MTDVANLDFARRERRGYPEAVLCQGKSVEQVQAIARAWVERAAEQELGPLLCTRVSDAQAPVLLEALPGAHHDPSARIVVWPAEPVAPTGGRVVVVCAGTADLPVADEAALTARYLGREVVRVTDVGVAGLHRVLDARATLEQADVVVVAAGMDAALVPVVAGLVSCPVVAVPTSTGYGASFDGVAALLSMLNSCAPGVAVVNIDNGYGAGHLAAQIAAGKEPRHA